MGSKHSFDDDDVMTEKLGNLWGKFFFFFWKDKLAYIYIYMYLAIWGYKVESSSCDRDNMAHERIDDLAL